MRPNHDPEVPPLKRSELWSLREDVTLDTKSGDGSLRLNGRWGEVAIERPSRLVREALTRMCLGPISLENVIGAGQGTSSSAKGLAEVHRVFSGFQPLIIRSLGMESGHLLLSVVPLTVRSRFQPAPLDADTPIRMSAFAGLRTDGTTYCLESPLALHRVVLHGPEAMALMASLAGPVTPGTVLASLSSIGEVAADALEYLIAAGMVVQAGRPAPSPPIFSEDTDPALSGWSAADLLFHTNSTLGRHDHNFGVTYPTEEIAPAEPVIKARAGQSVELHRPSWDQLRDADLPLTVAIEGRSSVRRHGDPPVTVTELGELLYRTARVRSLTTVGRGAEEAGHHTIWPPAGYEYSDRPYPSGGASYELELYVTVGTCEGIAPGTYHYDPLLHRLERVSADHAASEVLLRVARVAAAMDGLPQVLISMTARIGRLSWKYEGLVYRLALLHVGIMTQNLYLVCTAMRLAPCAVGSVSITVAARALGTDWRAEPCVGQFVLGRQPSAPGGAMAAGRDINDADWRRRARAELDDRDDRDD